MELMRGDMGGGAIVAAIIIALAESKSPVNVKGIIPLTENLPSGTATKPGDVVYAMNGKSICIDNTDAEGRLVLCDALCYADTFEPEFIVDIATLTGAIVIALGDCVAGAFCNNDKLWNCFYMAGLESGDRIWRMPLFKHYTKQISDYNGYDLNNMGKNTGGGACKAAAFLQEFVSMDTPWIHIDMAGVMYDSSDQSYICRNGMTGRPTRTVIELICKTAVCGNN